MIIDSWLKIKTLLEKLGRPDRDIPKILKKFNEVHSHIKKSRKFRSPEKLIPCVVYFYYKINNIFIDQGILLENSDLSTTEFNAFRMGMENFWSKYQNRDRNKFVLNRIGGVIGIAKTLSKREDIVLGPICEFLGISQGTLQKSVQRKLFDLHGIKNNEKGFKNKVEFLEENGLFKGL